MIYGQTILAYLFYPNPANAHYSSPKAAILLAVCVIAIVASFVLPRFRNAWTNGQLKKLSASWASACGWFGWVGLVMVISRVEEIQFVSMRFLWVLWGAALFAYLFVQARSFRSRYYEVLPTTTVHDARAEYLPKRKKR